MAEELENVDRDAMHRALTVCLPDHEPPIGVRVERVMRLGRRRTRTRRVIPLITAMVTAATVAVPWLLGTPAPVRQAPGDGPAPTVGQLQPGETAPTISAPGLSTMVAPPAGTASAGPPMRNSSSSTPSTQPTQQTQPPYRLPAGHQWNDGATALAKVIVDRLPPGKITYWFGTMSVAQDGGARNGFGFHELWYEGGRYGYFVVLHRTKGAFPATEYGLPVEPCTDPGTRLPEYHCAASSAPAGDTATSFEVNNGYQMRGVVWDKKDPAGGADIRVTGVFYLPAAGAWTPFPVLDSQPRLPSIPLSIQDINRAMGMPG